MRQLLERLEGLNEAEDYIRNSRFHQLDISEKLTSIAKDMVGIEKLGTYNYEGTASLIRTRLSGISDDLKVEKKANMALVRDLSAIIKAVPMFVFSKEGGAKKWDTIRKKFKSVIPKIAKSLGEKE